MEKNVFTRSELYELVWSEPIYKISKRFNIPFYELKKACIDMNIPLPENGYWTKFHLGMQVTKQNLTSVYTGVNEIEFNKKKEPKIKPQLKKHKPAKVYIVPQKLTNPDPLITSAKKCFESSVYFDYGLQWTRFKELNIKVATKNIDRALRIFDTIIKVFRSRNYKFEVKEKFTYVTIDGIDFEISLREKLTHNKDKAGSFVKYEYSPTDKLVFQYFHRWLLKKEWSDSNVLLEDKISDIIENIELDAKLQKEKYAGWERQRLIVAEKALIIEKKKERREEELMNLKILLKKAHQWHEAVILENYIKEFEMNALAKGFISDETKNWIIWARQKVEWFSPFIRKEDDILSDKDRLLL